MYTHIYIHTYIHTYMCLMFAAKETQLRVCNIHTYIHTHTYMHTHTHTHISQTPTIARPEWGTPVRLGSASDDWKVKEERLIKQDPPQMSGKSKRKD